MTVIFNPFDPVRAVIVEVVTDVLARLLPGVSRERIHGVVLGLTYVLWPVWLAGPLCVGQAVAGGALSMLGYPGLAAEARKAVEARLAGRTL